MARRLPRAGRTPGRPLDCLGLAPTVGWPAIPPAIDPRLGSPVGRRFGPSPSGDAVDPTPEARRLPRAGRTPGRPLDCLELAPTVGWPAIPPAIDPGLGSPVGRRLGPESRNNTRPQSTRFDRSSNQLRCLSDPDRSHPRHDPTRVKRARAWIRLLASRGSSVATTPGAAGSP